MKKCSTGEVQVLADYVVRKQQCLKLVSLIPMYSFVFPAMWPHLSIEQRFCNPKGHYVKEIRTCFFLLLLAEHADQGQIRRQPVSKGVLHACPKPES